MSHARGLFLVLEGIDGSGTTTQARRLTERLRERGHVVHQTAEPSSGPVGQLIRRVLTGGEKLDWATLALLFAADRADHVSREVEPQVAQGAVVVCDRYVLSSLTYQTATAPPSLAALPWLRSLNDRAPAADLTVVLRVSAACASTRRQRRGAPAELFEQDALQRELVQLYDRAAALLAPSAVVTLDGEGPENAVATAVLSAVEGVLPDPVGRRGE